MPRRVVIGLLAASLVLAAGWGFAQPKPAEEGKPAGPVGRYAVTAMDSTAVMLDTATGKTWVLTEGADKGEPPAWLPTVRIDGDEEAAKWRLRQRELAERLGRGW
jgi:hypothetical protein